MNPVLLFDLDETLMVEEPASSAAFATVADFAASARGIDAEQLGVGARRHARELWYAAPTIEYCLRVGISSWEGLWCRFEGGGPESRLLRDWAPSYREQTWRLALSDLGIDDSMLATELRERFGVEGRSRHEVYDDVEGTLKTLHKDHPMAVVTNGAACLQREKLSASVCLTTSRLSSCPRTWGGQARRCGFRARPLDYGANPDEAVMIGDSLAKDVDGALAAGLHAIWLNRGQAESPECRNDFIEISSLSDVPEAVARPVASTPLG